MNECASAVAQPLSACSLANGPPTWMRSSSLIDHITGVLSEHQAGVVLGIKPSGIKLKGRRSTPGRYFEIANPGSGWGGTDLEDPLSIVELFKPKKAWPGLTLLMVSTTGTDYAYYVAGQRPDPPANTPSRCLTRIG